MSLYPKVLNTSTKAGTTRLTVPCCACSNLCPTRLQVRIELPFGVNQPLMLRIRCDTGSLHPDAENTTGNVSVLALEPKAYRFNRCFPPEQRGPFPMHGLLPERNQSHLRVGIAGEQPGEHVEITSRHQTGLRLVIDLDLRCSTPGREPQPDLHRAIGCRLDG